MSQTQFDAIIIGAGAAGLFAAGIAGQRGRNILLIDHSAEIGRKILISGGGRCNFTNLEVSAKNFISENPDFARSALARYKPSDFIALVEKYNIPYYEKGRGQLFGEGVGAARFFVDLLLGEADKGGVTILAGCQVSAISHDGSFLVATDQGDFSAPQLVCATGGLSIPKIGATGFAFDLAKQFSVPVVNPSPALVPLTFAPDDRAWMAELAGLSVDVDLSLDKDAKAPWGRPHFDDGLVFTHRGLSGPAVLQISSYWQQGGSISLDVLGQKSAANWLVEFKKSNPRSGLRFALGTVLPQRLADMVLDTLAPDTRGENGAKGKNLADLKDQTLLELDQDMRALLVEPAGNEGYGKAEVTRGGISTHALNQKSMEVKTVPGLYFIGEAVDMTGWLGGYNFQWAWASGFATGNSL